MNKQHDKRFEWRVICLSTLEYKSGVLSSVKRPFGFRASLVSESPNPLKRNRPEREKKNARKFDYVQKK